MATRKNIRGVWTKRRKKAPKPNLYNTLYKEATSTVNKIYLFICIAAFFIFVAFFNYRISWKNTEDQFFYNSKRDYWFSSNMDTNDSVTFKFVLYDKHSKPYPVEKEVKSDDYLNQRFFESRRLPNNMVSSNVNEDKRMFLNMEALGVYLYIQDMPLIGGFVISMLFLWFIFARNNEYELFKKAKEEIEGNSLAQYEKKQKIDELLYEKLFRKARNSELIPYDGLIAVFLFLARSLFLVIWLMLVSSFFYDLYETYVQGPPFQKYVEVSATAYVKGVKGEKTDTIKLEKIPVFGTRCDYLIEKTRMTLYEDVIVNKEVPLKDFLQAAIDKKAADEAMGKINTMTFFSAFFLFLIGVQLVLIYKIFRADDTIRKELIKERKIAKAKTKAKKED